MAWTLWGLCVGAAGQGPSRGELCRASTAPHAPRSAWPGLCPLASKGGSLFTSPKGQVAGGAPLSALPPQLKSLAVGGSSSWPCGAAPASSEADPPPGSGAGREGPLGEGSGLQSALAGAGGAGLGGQRVLAGGGGRPGRVGAGRRGAGRGRGHAGEHYWRGARLLGEEAAAAAAAAGGGKEAGRQPRAQTWGGEERAQ